MSAAWLVPGDWVEFKSGSKRAHYGPMLVRGPVDAYTVTVTYSSRLGGVRKQTVGRGELQLTVKGAKRREQW